LRNFIFKLFTPASNWSPVHYSINLADFDLNNVNEYGHNHCNEITNRDKGASTNSHHRDDAERRDIGTGRGFLDAKGKATWLKFLNG